VCKQRLCPQGPVQELRDNNATLHIAHKRYSEIEKHTCCYGGYAFSQTERQRVEKFFVWPKTMSDLRKTRLRVLGPIGWMFTVAMAGCNLVRTGGLLPAPA